MRLKPRNVINLCANSKALVYSILRWHACKPHKMVATKQTESEFLK